MYSKLRAPRCATAVARYLREMPGTGNKLQVMVLRGGMQGWVNHWFRIKSWDAVNEHVAEFDTEIWQHCENTGRIEGKNKSCSLVHSMDTVWSKGGQKELALALEDALQDLPRCRHP